jgi:hypothetical protein
MPPGPRMRRSSYLWATRESTIRFPFARMSGNSTTFSALGYNVGMIEQPTSVDSAGPASRLARALQRSVFAFVNWPISCSVITSEGEPTDEHPHAPRPADE